MAGWAELCFLDVGGTFTDAFIVDENGDFALAKTPTTPGRLEEGFIDALMAAAGRIGPNPETALSQLEVLGYGSTIVINTIITRTGAQPGVLITAGFEDILLMERGKQAWVNLERSARIHPVTHRHSRPLVGKHLIEGITERVDCLGKAVVPLYEHEIAPAVERLVQRGAQSIVICFLWSFLHEENERKAGKIARDTLARLGVDIPVWLSVEVAPVVRDLSRLNATLIEAYTAPVIRQAFMRAEEELASRGFRGYLQVMQSTGGLAQARHVRAVETIHSGPVGGLIGGKYIGELYGFDNIITSDVGGTSFDVGMINRGHVSINRDPTVAGLLLNLPMAEVKSIGAGGGTIASVDDLSGRLVVGPQSAGAEPGPVCYGRGGRYPTVTDADLVLGYLDPRFFAGGRIQLDTAAARAAIKTQIAGPLNLTVEEAALGIRQLIDTRMRDTIVGLVAARGGDLGQYYLLAFGGAGPTHVAGYTAALPLRGILMFPFSAVFSAFGAACADYEHYYTHAVTAIVSPGADQAMKLHAGERLNHVWQSLETRAWEQMKNEGFAAEQIQFRHLAMMRYGRQLNDLIVTSPVSRITSPDDWDSLIATFEQLYSEVFSSAARFRQAGYDVLEAGLVVRAPKIRPRLQKRPPGQKEPDASASRPSRRACFAPSSFVQCKVWALDGLKPGNIISGPAFLDGETTTVLVPPGKTVEVDEYLTMWLKEA